jgi:hypothetical protein
MAKQPLPTPQLLRNLVVYEPETGFLFWRERNADMFKAGRFKAQDLASRWNAQFAGRRAFNTVRGEKGYFVGTLFDRSFYAHRVAWAIHYGEWPNCEIDHINHDKFDNRICNLRPVTRGENMCNISRSTRNNSGITGVGWCAKRKKWRAAITLDSKTTELGFYTTVGDAAQVRRIAERLLGFHPNHGAPNVARSG